MNISILKRYNGTHTNILPRKQLHVALDGVLWTTNYKYNLTCSTQMRHKQTERERERETVVCNSGNGECYWRGSEQQASDIQGLLTCTRPEVPSNWRYQRVPNNGVLLKNLYLSCDLVMHILMQRVIPKGFSNYTPWFNEFFCLVPQKIIIWVLNLLIIVTVFYLFEVGFFQIWRLPIIWLHGKMIFWVLFLFLIGNLNSWVPTYEFIHCSWWFLVEKLGIWI